MSRLTSADRFEALRRSIVAKEDRELPTLVFPAGTCGRASGALGVVDAARETLRSGGLGDRVRVRVTGCHGFCEMEPSALVLPQRTFYGRLSPENVPRIVEAAADGRVVEELLWADPVTGAAVARQDDIPFFARQSRLLLGQHENVAPTRIESYIANGGYAAAVKALTRDEPDALIATLDESGLRGRGGAGFPTGRKWRFLAEQGNGSGKYVVCNGDEGDPGAYMDRSLLEGNPHSIIEGMLIASAATGAGHGVIYVRSEYPLAIEHLRIALEQARAMGLLGEALLGGRRSFDIDLIQGAGAFVCGEETALIRSIEGHAGEPRQRPPFPVEKGIHGEPTLINNVETWANVPLIFRRGASDFRSRGTPTSPGTKIFSLVGKVRNTGLVEAPMGMTLREIVEDIGGGPVNGSVKAVQTGGPSGGCIPADRFDLPVDYDSLAEAGSIMGSGGMIVMDETTCMVDVAKYFAAFLKDESCGKCFTCRKGTQRMHEILDDISRGQGGPATLELLEELALAVKDTAMCGLGQTAANPVLSTLRYFRDEYLEHLLRRRCPAGVCRELITFAINDRCRGCRKCVDVCPVEAIAGERGECHVIDPDACVRCGACKAVCPFEAVEVS